MSDTTVCFLILGRKYAFERTGLLHQLKSTRYYDQMPQTWINDSLRLGCPVQVTSDPKTSDARSSGPQCLSRRQ
jgi:hypothetical protein